MRTKHTSNALKRHRKTFHLARHDPELWEQVKENNLLESLQEAQERASAAERRAEISEKMLERALGQADDLKDILAASRRMRDELNSKTNALEKLSSDHQKLQNRVSDLNKEARKLRRRVRRVMEREAPTASTTNRSSSNAGSIFINLPQEQIEDWVCDLTCKLIIDHKLPREEGLGAIGDILQALATIGTDDDIGSNEEEGEGRNVGEATVTEEPEPDAATWLSSGSASSLCPN